MSPAWQSDTLTISREISAPPERIFRALTEPGALMKWWGSRGPLTRALVNLRPGGEYRFELGDAGWIKGQYQVLEAPRRIVQTWFASRYPDLRNSVDLRLDPDGSGTRLTVVHGGLAGRPEALEEYRALWAEILELLGGQPVK
jgi:uncharacterized protein YndB with AHSA1/START domain